jgi:hypothetical protein
MLALAAGCGGGGQNTQPTQPEPAPVSNTTTPAAPSPAPVGAIANDDDYLVKAEAMANRLIEMFRVDGANCEKLAADLDRFRIDAASILDYENSHPEAKTKFDDRMKARQLDLTNAMTPAIQAC